MLLIKVYFKMQKSLVIGEFELFYDKSLENICFFRRFILNNFKIKFLIKESMHVSMFD